MQLKEFNIILDIKKHNKTDYFEVVQGDLNSNVLNITLVDGLNPYNLTDTNVEIVFAKPDRTTVIQDSSNGVVVINATEGKIQCTLSTNTIASPGKVVAEVRVLSAIDDILLTSTRFDFYVRKALITDDTIKSTNEWPLLKKLLVVSEEESIRQSNEEERIQNEQTREDNEEQRIVKETERINSENERIANEEIRRTNEQNRQSNEVTRIENENIRISQEESRVLAEESRENNEAIRQQNESKRESNEADRISNELARESNEAARIANENARVQAENVRAATFAGYEERISTVENDLIQHKLDYASQRQQDKLKVTKVEKELNDFKGVINQVNINQEPRQSVSGYGIVGLPKNAASGQVGISVKGNTEVDDEGNTKSTVSAIRVKSVNENLFDEKLEYGRYNISDGSEVNDKSGYRSLNFLKLPKNVQLQIITNDDLNPPIYGIFYDNKKNILGYREIRNGFTLNDNETYMKFYCPKPENFSIEDVKNIKVIIGKSIDNYVSHEESNVYIQAKDEEGNIIKLNSLTNGVKDEIIVSGRKLIKRIEVKSNITSGTIINFADMAEGGTYYAWNEDGETETGTKGDTLGINATQLIYQLAEPVEIPVQVSGTLLSYPSGTVYVENVVADAGIYTDKMTVLHQDLPIKALEKLSKIDYTTGLETELDVRDAVIAEDRLSFTHPDLVDGDIVFFTYEYDRESTEGETEIEYYDSRYVIKDSVTGKFYKWHIAVADGVPSIVLEEV